MNHAIERPAFLNPDGAVQEVSRGRNGDCSRSTASPPGNCLQGREQSDVMRQPLSTLKPGVRRAGTWLGFTCESPPGIGGGLRSAEGLICPSWLSVHSATARRLTPAHGLGRGTVGIRIRRGPAAGFAVAVIAALSFVAIGDGVAHGGKRIGARTRDVSLQQHRGLR